MNGNSPAAVPDIEGRLVHAGHGYHWELWGTGARETVCLLNGLAMSTKSWISFLPELTGLLRGWTVVAHNAAFEESFLGPLLEELGSDVLDTCENLDILGDVEEKTCATDRVGHAPGRTSNDGHAGRHRFGEPNPEAGGPAR